MRIGIFGAGAIVYARLGVAERLGRAWWITLPLGLVLLPAVGQGLLAIRSHVDVCDDRLLAVDALLEVRQRVKPYLEKYAS